MVLGLSDFFPAFARNDLAPLSTVLPRKNPEALTCHLRCRFPALDALALSGRSASTAVQGAS